MGLVSMSRMLAVAQRDGFAVGYFEAWDHYSLEAVIEAAAELQAPVIIGFGAMIAHRAWFDQRGLSTLGALGRTAAESAVVPVSLLLNEARSLSQVARGIRCGFNAVMLDTSHLPLPQNIEATRQVVAVARVMDASVEGELGELPSYSAEGVPGQDMAVTDPDEAREFVRETGVDALSVSVGNVHMMVGREAEIDFDLLAALQDAAGVPLVIHGGTSYPTKAVGQSIACGVGKFNVGTILKKAFLDGIRAGLSTPSASGTQQLIGSHLDADILMAGKRRMKAEVARLIRLYGGAGRASTVA